MFTGHAPKSPFVNIMKWFWRFSLVRVFVLSSENAFGNGSSFWNLFFFLSCFVGSFLLIGERYFSWHLFLWIVYIFLLVLKGSFSCFFVLVLDVCLIRFDKEKMEKKKDIKKELSRRSRDK